MKKVDKEVINNLLYYNNLKIVQNTDYFNFSLDSVLLPNFANILPRTKLIVDLCTGNAPIPLILSQKTSANIIGIEIQKEVYDLACKSIKINNLDNEIKIINDDINNFAKEFQTDSVDLITCNPPYFKYESESIINNNDVKSKARHEITFKLYDLFKISKKLLKNGGSVCFVHRTERLIEIIKLMKENNIEPKRIRFIYPKINSESNLILVDGRKNGKPGIKILSPLYVHKDNGEYTDEILKIFGKLEEGIK